MMNDERRMKRREENKRREVEKRKKSRTRPSFNGKGEERTRGTLSEETMGVIAQRTAQPSSRVLLVPQCG